MDTAQAHVASGGTDGNSPTLGVALRAAAASSVGSKLISFPLDGLYHGSLLGDLFYPGMGYKNVFRVLTVAKRTIALETVPFAFGMFSQLAIYSCLSTKMTLTPADVERLKHAEHASGLLSHLPTADTFKFSPRAAPFVVGAISGGLSQLIRHPLAMYGSIMARSGKVHGVAGLYAGAMVAMGPVMLRSSLLFGLYHNFSAVGEAPSVLHVWSTAQAASLVASLTTSPFTRVFSSMVLAAEWPSISSGNVVSYGRYLLQQRSSAQTIKFLFRGALTRSVGPALALTGYEMLTDLWSY